MLTAVNIQTPENGEESAHYAEIIEDENIQPPSQGTKWDKLDKIQHIIINKQ